MASVLDDATTRLYAGALLGKSLSKHLGEVGAQGTQAKFAVRQATLQAGVASDKIDPRSLSKGDVGLLGAALEPKQHISSNPFGFATNFFGNLAKGAGEFVESFKGLPQAVYQEGKAFGELGEGKPKAEGQILGGIAKGVAHDFSSPQQIYEHPFNPLIDVAGLFTGGAGVAVKGAGALARYGKFGEGVLGDTGQLSHFTGLTPTGERASLSGLTGPAAKLVRMGSEFGRPDAIASPGFKAQNLEKLREAGVGTNRISRAYSPNLGMKYAVQKPMDALFSKLSGVQVPNTEKTLQDIQGGWYAKKAINLNRAQRVAGANEAIEGSAFKKWLGTAAKIRSGGQGQAVYQEDAAFLRLAGIKTPEKLDEYAQKLTEGQDIDGPILDETHQRRAQDFIVKLKDQTFRDLVEKPTDLMKEYEYNWRRMNVEHAKQLDIDPRVSEDAAFARLRELTGKTTEELMAETPAWDNTFSKGLQALQEHITQGESVLPEADLNVIATHVPGVPATAVKGVVERAIDSLKRDVENVGPMYERLKDPDYLPGKTIYDKVGTALADRGLLHPEQAQAIARGVSFDEGAPTYLPSMSMGEMHYGLRGDPLKTKVGRVLGVAKFRPIEEGIPKQPEPYEFKRPFTARRAAAETMGLGPARNYLKEADYASWLKGTMQTSPEALAHNAYEIQRDLVQGKLDPATIHKIALKDTEGAPRPFRGQGDLVQTVGEQVARHYVVVPVSAIRDYVSTKAGLEMNFAKYLKEKPDATTIEEEINNLADESAHELLDGASHAAAMGNHAGLALPRTYVEQIQKHLDVSESLGNPAGKVNAMILGRWKAAVLSMMPKWLFVTTIGHGIIALIHGVLPGSRYAYQAAKYYQDAKHIIKPEDAEAIAFGKKYGNTETFRAQPEHLPYSVNQGGMVHELQDVGQSQRVAKQYTLPRAISAGVHVTTNWQRRAIFLRELDKGAKQRFAELGRDFENPGGFWKAENIDAVMDPSWRETVLQHPDLVQHAFDQLSKVSYTFGDMAPWERKLVKNVMPFYGWYKFISKFVWSMPFNYPGRTAAIAALGRVGLEENKSLGILPDYLESAIWFNHNDLSHAKYLPLYGLNPLENVANPFGKKGLLEGMLSAGQTSPLLQSLIAGSGIDPQTMEPEGIDPFSGIEQGKYGEWIDTKTGRQLPNIGVVNSLQRGLGTFMRSFPEVRTLELLRTHGNPVYPESIPFIDEHLKGVNPQTRRTGTLPLALLQELGFQPREYDILKHTQNVLKAIEEAKKKNLKSQQRTTQRLATP